MIDVGDNPIEIGDEVVLIGRQGDELSPPTSWRGLWERFTTKLCVSSVNEYPGYTWDELRKWPFNHGIEGP